MTLLPIPCFLEAQPFQHVNLLQSPGAFRIAAQTPCRNNSALGANYRRMQARMGLPCPQTF